jgi:hypothetical protein
MHNYGTSWRGHSDSKKKGFKILELKRSYDYKRQCKIVIACCVLHNFIRKHTGFEEEEDEVGEEPYVPDPITAAYIDVDATNIGATIRQEIRFVMGALCKH